MRPLHRPLTPRKSDIREGARWDWDLMKRYIFCVNYIGFQWGEVMRSVTCKMLLNYFWFVLVKFRDNKSLDFNSVA